MPAPLLNLPSTGATPVNAQQASTQNNAVAIPNGGPGSPGYTVPNSQFTQISPTGVVTGPGAYRGGTMNANISNPTSSGTSNPPAVVTSSAASGDLANKQQQVAQLNTDTANHQAIINTPPATPATTNGANNTDTNTGGAGTSTSSTGTGTDSSLDDQVNSILSSFNTNSASIEDSANTDASTYGDEATQAQSDLDTAAQASLAKLNQIATGVYPLSPAEQSILTATSQGFQSAIQYQTQANQAYAGQMTEAMASLGINTSAPTQAIGMIQAAIGSGATKIADLNSQMATSLGNLQIAFQKQDFDTVQQAWDETSTYMQNRVTELTNMQKNVQDAAHQQVSDLQAATQTNLSAMINSATFDQKTAQDAITNAFTQQQITETQRKDLADEADARAATAVAAESAAKGRYSFNADTGEVFDTETGAMVGQGSGAILNGTATPGHTGVPIVDNNTKTTASGVPYVDGTTLTGAQASEAQLEAAKLGIPYLGASGAAALNKIEEARENLSNINDLLSGKVPGVPAMSPANGVEKAGDTLTYGIQGATQSGTYGPALASYNTFRSAAIGALQAVAGGTGSGLRINQAEIAMSIKNDIPSPTDTATTRDMKLANMTSLLDSNEAQLLGTKIYNQYNPSAAQSNPMNLVGTSGSGTDESTDSSTNPIGI